MSVLIEGKHTHTHSLLVRKLDLLKEMNICYLLRRVKLLML